MKTKLEVRRGDITQVRVDAIVNAANTSLLGGGGVDGAIHRAGGPSILEECMQIRNAQGGCPVGESVITTAGKLPAKFVIHTVGPVWSGNHSEENQLLASCYRNSLLIAVQNHVKTLAFPNISTGIYRFPKNAAAEIAVHEVKQFISDDDSLELILFVCFDEENYAIYTRLLTSDEKR